MSTGGGDVGGAGLAVAADGEVAQGGHNGWAVAGADLAVVFGEGHIADPVQFVLDRPMIADDLGELVGADVTEAEVGDGLDGFGMPAVAGGASAVMIIPAMSMPSSRAYLLYHVIVSWLRQATAAMAVAALLFRLVADWPRDPI